MATRVKEREAQRVAAAVAEVAQEAPRPASAWWQPLLGSV